MSRAADSISTGLTPASNISAPWVTVLLITRVVKKPGASLTTMGVLPSCCAKSNALARVSSEVCRPRIISTKGIFSAGEKKCIPIKLCARTLALANSEIGSAEVFDANTLSLAITASHSDVTAALMPRSSKTASITMSQSANSA